MILFSFVTTHRLGRVSDFRSYGRTLYMLQSCIVCWSSNAPVRELACTDRAYNCTSVKT